MKYTDKLFRFPIRLADEAQIMDMGQRMSKGEDVSHEIVDTIDSYTRLPIIQGDLCWHEAFPPETDFKDLMKEGLQTTLVTSEKFGDFMCSWNMKKFEEELNKHMEKVDNSI